MGMVLPSSFGPHVQSLVRAPLPELGPGVPLEAARKNLKSLTIETLFTGHAVHDEDMARCCISALLLHNNFLDESHVISQEIETVEGSYWHGIMHRREPDAGNAKYWFRRVGPHPVLDEMKKTQGYTSPFDFIDFCERVRGSGSKDEQVARQIQFLEWTLLFDHCWKQATK